MVHRLVRIAPIKAAKIGAALYGLLGLFFLSSMVLLRAFDGKGPPTIVFLLIVPGYALLGFLTTAIVASLYNVVARFVGGIEVTLEGDGRPSGQE